MTPEELRAQSDRIKRPAEKAIAQALELVEHISPNNAELIRHRIELYLPRLTDKALIEHYQKILKDLSLK